MLQMLINPDLQTREAVMLALGRVQFAVTTPEGVRYVKVEPKRKSTGHGYEKGSVPLDEATHVFISEKGYGTTRLGTYYPPKGQYTTGRFFEDGAISPSDPHVDALIEVVKHVNGEPTQYEVRAEDQCSMCGMKLEDPESIARGIGPECAKKPTGSKILHASKFAPGTPDLMVDKLPSGIFTPEEAAAAFVPEVNTCSIPEFTPDGPEIDYDDTRDVTLTVQDIDILIGALGITICETDGTKRHYELVDYLKKAAI